MSSRGRTVSYEQLDEESSRLAMFLRTHGVATGDRVGLLLPKSASAVTCLFGILKAGAVYVPLDRAAPDARLAYILENAQIRCLIAGPGQAISQRQAHLPPHPLESLILVDGAEPAMGRFPAKRTFDWETVLRTPADRSLPNALPTVETDPAYILYTSGSTGEPKGVMISHLNALTFIKWSAEHFSVRPSDRLANHAPLHFDLSVFDIFAAMLGGASVHLLAEDLIAFPMELARWMDSQRITIWYSVPSALSLLVRHGQLSARNLGALRLVLFAGEVFPLKSLKALVTALPTPRYANLYGPTETNVCTYHDVDVATLPNRTDPLPIGRACANMATFALTESNQPVKSPGEVGELFVRGSGVALGYCGRPDLTAQRFVQNPLHARFRDIAYRTGDLITLNDRGEYLFLGRIDHQIKSRGYRIELGDIEAILCQHPALVEAVAIAIPDELSGNRIKAIVVPAEGFQPSVEDVLLHCAERLPRYMIPEVIEVRGSLPHTPNGKVDRRSLVATATGTE